MRTYVLATTPRAGAEILAPALTALQVAGRPQEYFVPCYEGVLGRWGVIRNWFSYDRFVEAVRLREAGPHGVFGVTLHWHQFAWLVRALHARRCAPDGRETAYGADAAELVDRALAGPRYVWLRREDTARQALDHYELISTGTVMPAAATERPRAVRAVSPADLAHVASLERLLVEQDRRWAAFFGDAGIEPLELRFEDLLRHPAQVVAELLEFLDLPAPPAVPDGEEPEPLEMPGSWAEAWGPAHAAARSRTAEIPLPPCAALDEIPTGPPPAEPVLVVRYPVGGERVVYSCVVDRPPYLRLQSLVWCITLLELGAARPDQIVVHAVEGADAEHLAMVRDLGVTVVPVPVFDRRHRYSNKLRQLESEALREADRVVLCDCDLAFCGDVSDQIGGPALAGRLADLGVPSYREWVGLQRAARVGGTLSPRRAQSLAWTYANNLNGGFLVVPAGWLEKLAEPWPRWARWLLGHAGDLPIRPGALMFTDQLALGLTLLELEPPVRELPTTINLSAVAPMFDTHLMSPHDALVLHYHRTRTSGGLLRATGVPTIDRSIDAVNAVLRRPGYRELLARAVEAGWLGS